MLFLSIPPLSTQVKVKITLKTFESPVPITTYISAQTLQVGLVGFSRDKKDGNVRESENIGAPVATYCYYQDSTRSIPIR